MGSRGLSLPLLSVSEKLKEQKETTPQSQPKTERIEQ
jgi:hypothetical protein